VNLVSKIPLKEPYYSPSLTIGSDDLYRPTLDASGPLNSSATAAYRLNLAYENSGSFRDFVSLDKIFVAPAFSWQIDPKTKLTFQFEYQNLDFVIDRGLSAVRQAFNVPISRFIGEPDLNRQSNNAGRASYILEHQINNNWKFRQGFAASVSAYELSEVSATGVRRVGDRTIVDREFATGTESADTYVLQNEVTGKFKTGAIAHNLLLGLEIYRQRDRYRYFSAPIDSLDLFNPVYGASKPTELTQISGNEIGADGISFYVQDQITLSKQWKVLVGGRFDWVHTINRSLFPENFGELITDERDFAFSPRAGIVYQPIEPISLYFSYSTSFRPLVFGGFSATREPLKPERGQQFEVGIKADLLRDRLSATFAAYQIKKENALVTDPDNPLFSIQTGEQTSRGFEFSLTGRPLPGWETSLGYAYTDAFVSEDTVIPVGDRLGGIPRHQVGFFNSYEIQKGPLKGLGFLLGLYYVSDREAALPNTAVSVPDYFRVDTGIFYKRGNWKLQLNVNNLTNITYHNSDGFTIFPQPPLTVLGQVSVEF
jgi:iron complex outermembrane recepter protein